MCLRCIHKLESHKSSAEKRMFMQYPKIGIRPVIDGRWGGVRESLEEQTLGMARAAAELIENNVKYPERNHDRRRRGSRKMRGTILKRKCCCNFKRNTVLVLRLRNF